MIKNYKEYISESNNKISNIYKLKQLYRKNGFTNEDIKQISDAGYFDNIEWIDNQTLKVYRSLSIPKSKLDDFLKNFDDGIGIYWSFYNKIESIWGSNAEYEAEKNEDIINIRCFGELKLSDIDFKDCLYAYKDDFHHFTDEKEIRGKNGGDTIKVIGYEIY